MQRTENLVPSAIHATQKEIDAWRQRSVSGPYGDDWERIQSRAEDFRRHPDSDLWPGNQTKRLWNGARTKKGRQRPNFHPHRCLGDGLRDAGFAYLVTGETSYLDAVRQTLLAQAVIPGTSFSETVKWRPQPAALGKRNVNIANWVRKLAYGYSYIRSALSQAERNTIDRWFLNAATFWDQNIHVWIASRFPRRYQDDYNKPKRSFSAYRTKGKTHWGGYTVYKFHDPWLNKPAAHNAMVAAVGVLLNDETLKAHAKRFVKEWLMFAVAGDGTVADQHRWNADLDPQTGYFYACTVTGSIVATVDHLARAGDTELYEYETTFGYYGWEGGPKSLRNVLKRLTKLALGERNREDGMCAYASTTGTVTPANCIGPGATAASDICLIPANLYYNDMTFRQVYTRPLPEAPLNGGYDPWGGDWGTYPGIRFMFGQLEGVVWPYPHPESAMAIGERKP